MSQDDLQPGPLPGDIIDDPEVAVPLPSDPELEVPSTLPADPAPEARASLPTLPSVAPSTTIESAAQNALIERVNLLSTTPLVQAGTFVGSSGPDGSIRITYPEAFAEAPIVLCQITSNGDMFVQPPDRGGSGASATSFTCIVRRVTDGGAITNSIALRFDWIAVGTRVVT